jgi:hypothetical protein
MRLRGAKLIVLGLLGFCAGIGSAALAEQTDKSTTGNSGKIAYAVEDLTLGDKADSDILTSRAYYCTPSEQFVGFIWCRNRASKGRVHTAYSILHSADGTIVYANKTLEPAFSSSAEAKEEVQRISRKIGAQPRIIDMPSRRGFPDGVIAVWGDVVLQPVDAGNINQLAEGKTPKLGFMVDFVADFQWSAKNGLPIYRISGGAGSVLAVSYGKPGRGTFRFIAVDAANFTSPANDQAPIVAQPAPAPEAGAIAAQSSPAPDQTAIVTHPSSQPTEKEKESQTNIAELNHTISSLRAELATSVTKITTLENQNSETERLLKQQEQARLAAEVAKRQSEQAVLQSQNAAQSRSDVNLLWTILASMTVGGLIALPAVRTQTLSNKWNKLKVASKLSSLTLWARQLQQNMSLRGVPEDSSNVSWISMLSR